MLIEVVAVVTAVAFVFLLSRRAASSQTVCPRNKAVLITGCDTGFGHELAHFLHQLGFTVFAGCLNSEGEGAKKLQDVDSQSMSSVGGVSEMSKGEARGRLHVIQLDITKEGQVIEAVQRLTNILSAESIALWAVVNNAGISIFGDVEFCGMKVYQRLADTNLWGTIRVCKAFLPLIRKAKGRIVNVTSILGRQGSPGRSCYVATKYALEGFTQCLRYEMRRWGVQVIVVEPGNYIAATGIFTQEKIDKIAEELERDLPAEVRESYGEDFFQSRVQRMRHFTRIGDTDKQPVVDAMVAAVIDVNPQIRYEPKTLYWRIRTFVMCCLPQLVGDFFYHSDT
ncbi:D-beta-hydroxybutyrate dehydrogenase, mitochondrial-like [Asterias amurensis]|uniref:D-beta-hydroxybutyrate dehydrogenase, mitochondrial-like n=1 Tax=Asterias amurensis TaxID=7602 RepID=UPI003AB62D84